MKCILEMICIAVLGTTTGCGSDNAANDKSGDGGTCVPMTCAEQGKTCGTSSDGCNGTLVCGNCEAPLLCSSDNVCTTAGSGGSGGGSGGTSGSGGSGGSGGSSGSGGSAGGNACTVNWLDPLAYPKPPCVEVHGPDEATVQNKYWIDLTDGSGSDCTETNPCDDFDDVLGKPGTTGGPAIIYVKGKGAMSWYEDDIHGSGDVDCRTAACDSWILIRTWPAGSPGCTEECTATITGNSNMNSQNVHHVVWDGGPDLKIHFESNGQGTYAQNINSDWHVVYRTQTYCTGSSNHVLGIQVGSTTVASHVKFINNEFHSCDQTDDQASAIYVGPGEGGGYDDLVIQNNIVRDWGGEGLEINPRVTSSGMLITGNAIHHNGFVTCATGWKCRPGIVLNVQSGGGNDGTVITNNLLWDHASGCIWDRGGGNPAPQIANNTCFDFGKGPSGDANPNPEGISGYGGAGTAVVRNNILFAANGTNPFNGSYSGAKNNACASGKSCGSASATWSASEWLATTPGANFLGIGATSTAHDSGDSIAFVGVDYRGISRPKGAATDIGALEHEE